MENKLLILTILATLISWCNLFIPPSRSNMSDQVVRWSWSLYIPQQRQIFPVALRKLTNYFASKMIGGRCEDASLPRDLTTRTKPRERRRERKRKRERKRTRVESHMYKNVGARQQLVSSTKHFLLVAAGIVLAPIRYAKEAKQSAKIYSYFARSTDWRARKACTG